MSNIDIKVTADVVDLQAKFAIAKAESSALSSELNKLAKEANAAGGPSDELKAKIYAVAEQSTAAKSKVAELRSEIRTASDDSGFFANALGEVTPLLGAFGVAMSAAAVVGFARSALDAAAAIQREADALEISTTNYQAYQTAARESGAETDTATLALKRFVANLGEMQKTGAGPLATDLTELGLTADELSGDPTEALITFARAWDKLTDTELKAAIERNAFGRSGIEMTALLHNLAQGSGDVSDKWKEMADRASELGEMMDSKTTKAAQRFDIEIDSLMTQAKASVAGFFQVEIEGWQGIAGAIGQALQKQDEWSGSSGRMRQPNDKWWQDVPAPTFLKPQIPNVTPPDIEIEKAKGGRQSVDHAAEQQRRILDEQAQAEVQANEKRIEGEQSTNAFLLEMGRETLDQFEVQARSLEDQRYAIALDGLHKREAADAGDKVAFARDKAEEQVIYQEHVNRLTTLDQQYQLKKQQIARTELQEFERDENAKLERGLALYESDFKAHQISAEREHDLEQQLTLAIEREVLARFDAENSGLKAGTEAYAKAMKERQAIVDGFAKHVEEQDNSLKDEEAQKWRQLSDSIRSSFNSALDNMLFHGGTFRQFMQSVAIGIAEAFLQMGEKIAEDWIERQIAQIAATQTSQAAQTGAVVAGQAAQTAAVAAGAGAKSLVSAEADSKSILNAAYTSAAEAYKSVMEAVPPPANLILAPIAAAGTFAAVAAFDVISAEGGLDRVRYNGQLIQAHVDESVTPANVAIPQRDFFSDSRVRDFLGAGARKFDGSLSGGAAAMNGATHYHSHEWNIGSDLSPDHILRDPTKRRIFERYIENEFAKAVK